MFKLLYSFFVVLIILFSVIPIKGNDTDDTTTNESKLVRLDENNFVSLRGSVDEESASAFVSDIMKIKGNKIYIYLVTPGGSIISGNTIVQTIDTLTASGKKIICIADHAYSMGFVIFQSCPVRYILPHSIIMQHQASLQVKGPINQARNMFKLVEKIVNTGNIRQAERLGVTLNEFNLMTEHDLWLYGNEIIEKRAADEVINVICDFDPEKTYELTKFTMFGIVKIIFSHCPLIHTPISVNFDTIGTIGPMDQMKIKNDIINEYEKFKLIDV